MIEIVKMLFSSPIFYFFILVLVFLIVFRTQISNILSRTTEASGKLSKDGIEGSLKAFDPEQHDVETLSGVDMENVSLKDASEIDTISGNVKMREVNLDQKSRIGKIQGK